MVTQLFLKALSSHSAITLCTPTNQTSVLVQDAECHAANKDSRLKQHIPNVASHETYILVSLTHLCDGRIDDRVFQ